MLGAEAAAEVADHCVHRVHDVVAAGQEGRGVHAHRLFQVHVDVAVAQVAERHRPDAGDQLAAGLRRTPDQLRHFGDRHRDVVLHAGAFALLRFRVLLADAPNLRLLRRAFGDGSVQHLAALHRLLQHGFQQVAQPGLGPGAGQVHQHVVVVPALQRVGATLDMLQREADTLARQILEGAHRGLVAVAEAAEQRQRRVLVAHGAEGDRGFPCAREQPQHGGGDEAQRALGAHEQMAQRVAGVVLAQPTQAIPDLPIRQHHFQAQHQFARVAVAHRGVAAGIGGQHATDGGAALGAQAEREQAAGSGGGVLRRLQDHAGFAGHGHVHRVDVAHSVQPGHGDDDLPAAFIRCGAADHAGIATLGHQGHAGGGAQLHRRGQLGGAAGADHIGRGAAIQRAPISEMRLQAGGVGQQATRAEQGGKLGH